MINTVQRHMAAVCLLVVVCDATQATEIRVVDARGKAVPGARVRIDSAGDLSMTIKDGPADKHGVFDVGELPNEKLLLISASTATATGTHRISPNNGKWQATYTVVIRQEIKHQIGDRKLTVYNDFGDAIELFVRSTVPHSLWSKALHVPVNEKRSVKLTACDSFEVTIRNKNNVDFYLNPLEATQLLESAPLQTTLQFRVGRWRAVTRRIGGRDSQIWDFQWEATPQDHAPISVKSRAGEITLSQKELGE